MTMVLAINNTNDGFSSNSNPTKNTSGTTSLKVHKAPSLFVPKCAQLGHIPIYRTTRE